MASDKRKTVREFIEITKDSEGQWSWIMYSANGREIAKSAHKFTRRNELTQSINLMKKSAQSVPVILITGE